MIVFACNEILANILMVLIIHRKKYKELIYPKIKILSRLLKKNKYEL